MSGVGTWVCDNAVLLQWGGHFLLALLHLKVRVSTQTSRYPSTERWSPVILSALHRDFESLKNYNGWRTARLPLSDLLPFPFFSPVFFFFFFLISSATFSSVQRCTVILREVSWSQPDSDAENVSAGHYANIEPSPSVLWDWDFYFNPFKRLHYLTSSVRGSDSCLCETLSYYRIKSCRMSLGDLKSHF